MVKKLTMVERMLAEMSEIRKENRYLKKKCIRFDNRLRSLECMVRPILDNPGGKDE